MSLDRTIEPALPLGRAPEDDLLDKLDGWGRDADSHWLEWRRRARESFAFVANDQWSREERAVAEEAGRLVTTINRIGAMVNAVAGAEITGRQQVQFVARSLEDGGVNEVLTKGADWIRDQTDADREESEAFRDTLICGLGFTETVMSYEEEPEGKVVIARVDPLEVAFDPSARKPNLTDARFVRRARRIARADFEALYPGATPIGAMEPGGTGRSGGNRRLAYRDLDWDEQALGEDEVVLSEWQWFELETAYAVEHPQTRAIALIGAAEKAALEAAHAAQGRELHVVAQRRRRYWRAVVCGGQVLEYDALPDGEFTLKAITGERDRNRGVWYGVVEAMKDPQRFANLFFSLLNHIVRTNAKGGILAEEDAFEDAARAEQTWARPDAITWLAAGGLNKIRDKPAPEIPGVIGQLLQISVQGVREASGINEEMLGLTARDQAGVLEHQRKQAAYGILAAYYDSLSSYRKQQGRLLLKYIQKYMPAGTLVRIVGDDGVARYVPLAKSPDTLKFDVIVDEAPSGPNQKERTWQLVVQMMPWLQNLSPDVWAELVRYSPFPDAVAQKIIAALQRTGGADPPGPLDQARAVRDQARARMDLADAHRTEIETARMAGVSPAALQAAIQAQAQQAAAPAPAAAAQPNP